MKICYTGGNNGEITFTFSTSEDENQCLTIVKSRGSVEDRVGRSQPGQSFLARQRQQTQQRRNQTRSVGQTQQHNRKKKSGGGNGDSDKG